MRFAQGEHVMAVHDQSATKTASLAPTTPGPLMHRALARLATVAIAAMISLWPGFGQAATQAQAQSVPAALSGTFKSYSPGTNEVTVAFEQRDRTLQLGTTDAVQRRLLGLARPGDVLTLNVDDAVEPETITKVASVQRPVSAARRSIAFGVALLLAFLAALVATRSHPLRFLVGVDNRYSNSQFQLVAWFAALAVVYLATLISRTSILGLEFVGGIAITANLVALTGLSALSFGAAKAITVSKLDKAGVRAKPAALQPHLLTDLFTNDEGHADLGDFQMIGITVVAIAIFLVTAFSWLHLLSLSQAVTLPDIDSSLLTGFGVGQGAYLIKKAAVNVGAG
jgi:hypothetical protein